MANGLNQLEVSPLIMHGTWVRMTHSLDSWRSPFEQMHMDSLHSLCLSAWGWVSRENVSRQTIQEVSIPEKIKQKRLLIQSQKLYSLSSDTFYLLRQLQTLPVSRRKGPKLQLSMEGMSKSVVNLHHIETGGKGAGYNL